MTPSQEPEKKTVPKEPLFTRTGIAINRVLNRIVDSRGYRYTYMIALLMYLLIAGYILVFSGSLFFEAIMRGGYRPTASDYDQMSLYLGYLYGFASLLGVIGALFVLSTPPERFYKFKVLFFIPSVIWSVQLVLGNFKWGFTYWTQWLYLVPIMLLCLFVFLGVLKNAPIPFFSDTSKT